jgi:hypothetical protein
MALTDSIVAFYKFNDGSGNASDATGNGHTLTNNNGVAYSSTNPGGQLTHAASFSKSSSQFFSIAAASASAFALTSFTFAAWINVSSNASSEFRGLISKITTNTSGYAFGWGNSGGGTGYGRALAQSGNDTGGVPDVLQSFSIGTWYFVVCTYSSNGSGSGTGATMTFYTNGSAAGSDTSQINIAADTGAALNIGYDQYPGAGNTYWNGYMAGVGIWSRALSSAEVSELYNGGSPLAYPFSTSTNWTKTLTETVTNTPSLLRHATRSLSLTLTTTASLVESVAKGLAPSEIVNITATLLKHPTRPLAQSVTPADSLTRKMARVLSQTTTTVPTFVRTTVRPLSATVTNTAAVAKKIVRTLTESNQSSVLDSYSEANRDTAFYTYSGSSSAYVGQSFTTPNDGKSYLLSSAKFYLTKTLTPTGSVYAAIYAHTGTYGTSGAPTGAPLAVSDPVDVSALQTGLNTFTFSGGARISLSPNTHYVAVVYYPGGDASNFVNVYADSSSSTASGNIAFSSNGTSWTGFAIYDACFYVYGIAANGLVLSDALASAMARPLVELLTSSAAVVAKAIRAFSESIALSDVLLHPKGLGAVLTDALAASDTFTRALAPAFVESFSLTDTLHSGLKYGRVFTEALSTADGITRAIARVLAEKLTLIDLIRQLRNGLAALWQNTTRTVVSWVDQSRSSDAWTDENRSTDAWSDRRRDI